NMMIYSPTFHQTFFKVTLKDAGRSLWRKSENYKPKYHGQQPGNLLQDHHTNSGPAGRVPGWRIGELSMETWSTLDPLQRQVIGSLLEYGCTPCWS
ncbi:hypothetical protein L9F63_000904, partial [Diploptera punctata]